MSNRFLRRLSLAIAFLASPTVAAAQIPCGSGSTTTSFSGGTLGAGAMFDIAPSVDMTIECLDVDLTMQVGTFGWLQVWYCPVTAVGNETNPTAWSLLASGSGAVAGPGNPTRIDITGNGVVLAAGQTYGVYVDFSAFFNTGLGELQSTPGGATTIAGTHGSLTTHCANSASFGTIIPNARWNGTLYTENAGPPNALTLALSGTCPGPATLHINNATPGGNFAMGYAFSAGTAAINRGPCTGTLIQLVAPVLVGVYTADLAGQYTLPVALPAGACGTVSVQVVDQIACKVSNLLAL